MRTTNLTDGFSVSAIGLGCSSMSHGYGPTERDDEESVRVIHRAVSYGIDIFDTADVYGPFTNELLLGRALRSHRDDVTIATKCGLVVMPDGKFHRNGRPDYLRAACEGSLQRLQVDVIDLYQLHRVDPAVPLVETWGALGELVTEGKVRALGISHATCDELELLHSVFPITAVQYELSVWATANREDVLPWSQKNNVGFLAFAPLGRGYLSGKIDHSAIGTEDSRNRDPRFLPDAMSANHAIVEGLRRVGARHGATPAQVAIAWTLAQGDNVVPIPGTRKLHWLRDNAAAVDLHLTSEDLRDIDDLPQAVGEMSWDQFRSAGADRPTRRT
ncbi:aldo/keto reductase [Streptosporangium sp. NPDC002544]|uniref:aldo/keto reductase n=1 Tax=Streptosporangium sp. NPDC002544 TaxID=3154538 RepID=UPI00332CAAE0